jgi:hypothetical protein
MVNLKDSTIFEAGLRKCSEQSPVEHSPKEGKQS